MNADKPENFQHTTLKVFPESRRPDGTCTPKRAGITLLDEDAKHTGVYIRDAEGGLWPARTVSHTPKSHHKSVCDAWLAGPGVPEDKRSPQFRT